MEKNTFQRLIHMVMAMTAIAILLVSCQQDEWFDPSSDVPEGYVALRFSADIPDMEIVNSRSVDPDGGGVQNMTLFCFDSYGLFITTVTAEIKSEGASTGTFQAKVPENTRTVHFVANQVMTDFEQDQFRNKSESEVMALLEGSSGRMIYWARFACDNSTEEMKKKSIADQIGNSIKMLRNHAKVSVLNPTENGYFIVNGFAVYNTNAFGTVAPFHPEKGFNFTEDDWKADDFVSLPANEAKLSDITDVTTGMGRYVFECENRADDPVSIILYGYNSDETPDKARYYRIMLVNEKGDQLLIRRNHDYQVNIVGKLSFGQATFAEALEAAATNNVWISISDKVNEVEDNGYVLSVAQTDYVLDAETNENKPYTLSYTIKGKNGIVITEADKAEVTWLDNEVARQPIGTTRTEIKDNVVNGVITINLLPIGNNQKLEGTLLVKHGRLQRKIKIIMVKEQSFAPSWVGTQIYGGMNLSDPTLDRSHVTAMFTVPETTPAELFPMKVYVSVGGLDIRPESGMKLTVVRDGDKDWYSSGDITPEPDYKYLYIVEQPGVQRVYFENILSLQEGYTGNLHIEAEHFETMNRTFVYSSSRKSITVEGLKAYNAAGGGIEGASNDELILYRLVPQKKNAHVQFDLQLREKTGDDLDDDRDGTPFNAEPEDEFMLYSRYLDFYTDEEVGQVGVDRFDCLFYEKASGAWWRKNNPNGGRMLMFKPREEIINKPADQTGKYSIYLKSNRPKSAEVIRIASNRNGTEAVLETDALQDGTYAGNSYRSVTFELANYNPFRFGAKLNHDNTGWQGQEPDRGNNPTADVPELLTSLEWPYEPGKTVDIAFDITSFAGTDSKSVDPFGETFEVYIDAPMLALGNNPNLDGKLSEVSPGRFVYKVDADREKERAYFPNSEVINKDNTPGTTVNQSGERKTLHFTTKSIVSAGDITISSNKEQVVFYSKTFRVTNSPISGNIYYTDGSGNPQPIPANAFVAFERVSNSSRIGAVTIAANGRYELRLRKEYSFNWNTNPVKFHYEVNGAVYSCTYNSLAELFDRQKNVVLTLEKQ